MLPGSPYKAIKMVPGDPSGHHYVAVGAPALSSTSSMFQDSSFRFALFPFLRNDASTHHVCHNKALLTFSSARRFVSFSALSSIGWLVWRLLSHNTDFGFFLLGIFISCYYRICNDQLHIVLFFSSRIGALYLKTSKVLSMPFIDRVKHFLCFSLLYHLSKPFYKQDE